MNYQKLIIYDYSELFDIMNELKKELSFEIIKISKRNLSSLYLENDENILIITQKKIPELRSKIIVNNLLIKRRQKYGISQKA